eukprot:427232_1
MSRETSVFIKCELRVEKINTQEQNFTVSGWIDFFWRGQHVVKRSERNEIYNNKDRTYGPSNNIWKFVHEDKVKEQGIRKPFGGSRSLDNFNETFGGKGNKVESLLSEERKYELRYAELYEYDENDSKDNGMHRLMLTSINAEKMDREEKEIENECLFWLSLHIRGTFDEFFEMEQFPFDKQFLNVPIKFRTRGYKPVTEMKDLNVENVKFYPSDKEMKIMYPVRSKLVDSVWTCEWNMLPPYVVLSRANQEVYDFAYIKLRVVRKPQHYIVYSLLPVFLITSCIFSIFALSGNDRVDEMNNRLTVVLTLLLTIVATQVAAAEGLPNLPTTTIVDNYILVSYMLHVLTIPFTIVSALATVFDDEDKKKCFDMTCGIVFGILWAIASFLCLGGIKYTPWYESWKKRFEREEKAMSDNVYHKSTNKHVFTKEDDVRTDWPEDSGYIKLQKTTAKIKNTRNNVTFHAVKSDEN